MELQATIRTATGRSVKKVRTEGHIPAELYGKGIQNQHLAVDAQALGCVLKEAGESTIVTLVVGKEKHPVIIHEVQRDPVYDVVRHIDLYQVRMDEKITAYVSLKFEGEAPAVKEHGGVLNRSMDEVEIEALPGDMPHHIVVDLSTLKDIGESIHVKDLLLGKGVIVTQDGEAVVANVAEFKEVVEEPVAAPSVEDVEVVGKKKKEEDTVGSTPEANEEKPGAEKKEKA